jgi:hypothetical protein
MKILDKNLLKQGKVEEAILVHSYEEYRAKGGQRDMLDCYAHFKELAKKYESNFIQMMDMDLSGIPMEREDIYYCRDIAQAFWTIIHLWFHKPLRIVDFNTFSLKEFNNI